MKLLQALIKERNLKWPEIIARTAERFTAMNALKSSGFQLTLAENLSNELEERSSLYITHVDEVNLTAFREFYENEENLLRQGLSSRFGITLPGKEKCAAIREKYEAIVSLRPQNIPKKPIGFHI